MEANKLDLKLQDPGWWGERIQWIVNTYEDGNLTAAMKPFGLKSTQGVSNLYHGRSVPGGATLARILRHYRKVNPEWLLLDRGPRQRPPDTECSPYAAGIAHLAEHVIETVRDALRDNAPAQPGDRTDQLLREAVATTREMYAADQSSDDAPQTPGSNVGQ